MVRRKRRRLKKQAKILLSVITCFCIMIAFIFFNPFKKDKEEIEVEVEEKVDRVSLVAVGDNMIHEKIFNYAKTDTGYDFKKIYEPVKHYISISDLAYINQETQICGDEYGIKGYPSFNSPEDLIDDLKDTGFDLVSGASNHSLDLGPGALKDSARIWKKQKDIVFTGIHTSKEDRDTIRTIKKNNITFSFLSYTYGINEYGRTKETENYYKNHPYILASLDKEQIAKDVKKAKEVSDVIIVAVHWGKEGSSEVSKLQKEYAQYFADLGVDVVIGSHPHVIQPMEMIDDTLVIYSLGNFVSTMSDVSNQLEGMACINFIKKNNKVKIENVTFIPLVNHYNSRNKDIAVYPLKDYTKKLASEHAILKDIDDPIGYFKKKVKKLIPEEFNIEM